MRYTLSTHPGPHAWYKYTHAQACMWICMARAWRRMCMHRQGRDKGFARSISTCSAMMHACMHASPGCASAHARARLTARSLSTWPSGGSRSSFGRTANGHTSVLTLPGPGPGLAACVCTQAAQRGFVDSGVCQQVGHWRWACMLIQHAWIPHHLVSWSHKNCARMLWTSPHAASMQAAPPPCRTVHAMHGVDHEGSSGMRYVLALSKQRSTPTSGV